MKPLRIVLIVVALISVEVTEAPGRKLLAELGFVPDQVKAAQCLTVSHFLPENEARIWSGAANEKISYWLEHESGCSTPMECMQRQLSVIHWAEQKAHPDGNSPSKDILSKWRNSEFCQNLVTSYIEKSRQGDYTKSTLEAPQPQAQQEPQIKNPENTKLMRDEIDHSPNAEPNSIQDATSKQSGKSWQDNNGFLHFPDGSISKAPVD